jgi:hypothetical protein
MAYDELPIPGIEQMMRLIFRHEDDKLWSQQGEMDAWKYRLKVTEKLNKQNKPKVGRKRQRISEMNERSRDSPEDLDSMYCDSKRQRLEDSSEMAGDLEIIEFEEEDRPCVSLDLPVDK